ncbi:MAG TPA: NUDIX domain-containing protein, partial [Acholeplasma sp.]|nr:NUDIX domain-containing protein [Acholeplasma sp.]
QLDRVLMIYHKLYNSWSWTGGHMDGDLNFLEVATKEAKEETGLINLKLYSETPVSIESLPVWFHIKHDKPISSHLHLNVSYVFIASDTEKLILNAVETEGLKWILIKDLKDYVSEPDMIPIYEKIIKRVMI